MRISDWSSDVCSSDLDYAFEAISDDAHKLDTVASQFLFGLLEPVVGLGLLEIGLMSLDFEKGDHYGFILPSDIERVGAPEIGRGSCRAGVCQYVSISVGEAH